LPDISSINDPFQLIGYVDAAHGNDLRHRCSTTGYGFSMLAGGVVAYRCKTNPSWPQAQLRLNSLLHSKLVKLPNICNPFFNSLHSINLNPPPCSRTMSPP
jgi:hypothetical protein